MSSKLPKVLHLVESYGGGVASVVSQYSKLAGFEHLLLARARTKDLHSSQYPSGAGAIYSLSLFSFLKNWISLRAVSLDIVHAHSSIAGLVARVLPHPTASVVYSPHAFAFEGHRRSIVRLASLVVEKSLIKRTHVGVAVSQAEAFLFEKIKLPKTRIVLVPHALESAQSRKSAPLRRRVISVGRVSFQKNPLAIVELKNAWFSKYPDSQVSFEWLGGGEPEIEHILTSSGVSVSGWVSNAQVQDALGSVSVLFHPARYEGLPMAVLESLAAGTPVLASDIPPHRNISGVSLFKDIADATGKLVRLMQEENWLLESKKGQESIRNSFNQKLQESQLQKAYSLAVENK